MFIIKCFILPFEGKKNKGLLVIELFSNYKNFNLLKNIDELKMSLRTIIENLKEDLAEKAEIKEEISTVIKKVLFYQKAALWQFIEKR